MAQQLQQMELVTSPTTTGDETMVAQAKMLDQSMYIMLSSYNSADVQFTIIQQIIQLTMMMF